jgi:hypothetical protein
MAPPELASGDSAPAAPYIGWTGVEVRIRFPTRTRGRPHLLGHVVGHVEDLSTRPVSPSAVAALHFVTAVVNR